MNAKEMFKKLGYEKVKDKFYACQYRKIVEKEEYYWEHNIKFDNKCVLSDKYTSIELLQAINKQCEELGWYE